jgi:hypothetical protein
MRMAFALGIVAAAIAVTPASAIDQVSREQDIINLRLGQRVQVDDGSCPTGQIKEIQGSTMTTSGISRVTKCVPRMGTKTR